MKYPLLIVFILLSGSVYGQWPMQNDPAFNPSVEIPAHPEGKGPKILLDGGHHNFFIQWDFIKPFADLAANDGYVPVIDSAAFTSAYLGQFEMVMIVTALPFDFTTQTEVTTESTFTKEEIENLYQWVINGGSLLVFSEHAPFDQAINPLLNQFGITSSVGTTVDTIHYNKSYGSQGWIEYSTANELLNEKHPIISGRNEKERVNRILTFGGSALSGEGFENILQLSGSSKNVMHATGVGPYGKGVSQCLAGKVGKGKVVAMGDSNGFTAMVFNLKNGRTQKAGMNLSEYDWKLFVLNTLHWLEK